MDHEAIELVTAFVVAMHGWEETVSGLPGSGAAQERQAKNLLKPIWEAHVTSKARPQGRMSCLSWGEPGSFEYEPKGMRIDACEHVDGGWIVRLTQGVGGYEEKFAFRCKRTRAGLRIDSKKRYSSRKDRWVRASL